MPKDEWFCEECGEDVSEEEFYENSLMCTDCCARFEREELKADYRFAVFH